MIEQRFVEECLPDKLFIGKNITEEKRFMVVSFYTDGGYEEEALRLKKSLDKFEIPYNIEKIQSRGSWITNVNYKARFCQYMLFKHAKAIIWLDCDAEVVDYPVVFDMLHDYDIGLYYRDRPRRPRELLTGTLYFNFTTASLDVLDEWIDMCRLFPNVWDQLSLQKVMEEIDRDDIKIFDFPSSYVKIFDAQDMLNVKPVITHWQASRRLKRGIT